MTIISPTRTRKYNRRPVHSIKAIPHPQEMDNLEEQEIAQSRLVVKKTSCMTGY